jgi:hypothetical protein
MTKPNILYEKDKKDFQIEDVCHHFSNLYMKSEIRVYGNIHIFFNCGHAIK